MADTEDVECWASMADAFDFGDVDHALRETSVLIPVPTLDTPAAELDSLDTLATRFACDFRSKLPCVTRRAAAVWMSGSRLGRGGGEAVFGSTGCASSNIPVVLLEKSIDGKTFLGRGSTCHRREGVAARDAWVRVTQRPENPSQVNTERCYFRAPLGPELWSDIDFRPVRAIFGDGEKRMRFPDETGGPPPLPFSEKTSSVWVSSPGCVTPTHFDLCHGLLTQIRGIKRVLLVPPEHTRSMHRVAPGSVNPNSSPVDLSLYVFGVHDTENVSPKSKTKNQARLCAARDERVKHPKTANAFGEIRETTLEPGDTLYIPPFWWHQVVTEEEENEEDKEEANESFESKKNQVSVSLLLAFDPVGDEGVHPCVEES